ncbi:MAG: methionine gamma-lyase family protein, partial [Ruminococcus sp.]|nr:methionine gamma-lyase family protein [Ruminococcus sp.]
MNFFDIDKRILEASEQAMKLCADKLREVEEIQEYNQIKMIKAFQNAGVRESYFCASTGYGYDDCGRDALDRVYAYVFDAEDALVRHNFVSGTHALTVALFGILRPNDTMLSVTGMPYDTIRSAIGIEGSYPGSLKDFDIRFEMTELCEDGTVDYEQVEKDIAEKQPKMVYIQRSRGYSLRATLTWREIKKICDIAKRVSPKSVIMLDNCYGEFIDKVEPLTVGVDIMAGSLIKNPGGGIAPTGGYIAGRADLVEMCAYRLTTPGTGKEIGATLGVNREMFMGAYHAPHVTGEALKTAVFASALFELLGFDTNPRYCDSRGDIIQLI